MIYRCYWETGNQYCTYASTLTSIGRLISCISIRRIIATAAHFDVTCRQNPKGKDQPLHEQEAEGKWVICLAREAKARQLDHAAACRNHTS
jgi:hypothetical protein